MPAAFSQAHQAIPAIQSLDVVGIEQIVDLEPRLEPNPARIDVRRDTPVHLRLAILELGVVRVEKHVHAGGTPRPGPGATRGQVAPQRGRICALLYLTEAFRAMPGRLRKVALVTRPPGQRVLTLELDVVLPLPRQTGSIAELLREVRSVAVVDDRFPGVEAALEERPVVEPRVDEQVDAVGTPIRSSTDPGCCRPGRTADGLTSNSPHISLPPPPGSRESTGCVTQNSL